MSPLGWMWIVAPKLWKWEEKKEKRKIAVLKKDTWATDSCASAFLGLAGASLGTESRWTSNSLGLLAQPPIIDEQFVGMIERVLEVKVKVNSRFLLRYEMENEGRDFEAEGKSEGNVGNIGRADSDI